MITYDFADFTVHGWSQIQQIRTTINLQINVTQNNSFEELSHNFNPPIHQSSHVGFDGSIDQPTYQPINQSINQSVNKSKRMVSYRGAPIIDR